MAVLNENERIVQLVLEANADPNDSMEDSGTVLQVAASKGNELIVKHLLKANADVNLQCSGNFGGVRDPQRSIQLKLFANQLCYIDNVHYSLASGSLERE